MNTPTPVDPPGDDSLELSAALAALASFQSLTQQVDARANMLLAIQVGIAAVVVAQLEVLTTEMSGLRLATGAAYLVALVTGGEAIIQTMRPRTGLYPSRNPFGVPPRAVRFHSAQADGSWATSGSVELRSKEAWEVARAVALIASYKNQYVLRAIAWMIVTSLLASAWFALVALGY